MLRSQINWLEQRAAKLEDSLEGYDLRLVLGAFVIIALYTALSTTLNVQDKLLDQVVTASLSGFLDGSEKATDSLAIWNRHHIRYAAIGALLLDTVLLVPIGFFLLIFYAQRSSHVSTNTWDPYRRVLHLLALLSILVLAIVDETENLTGLATLLGASSLTGIMQFASMAKWILGGLIAVCIAPVPLLWFFSLGSTRIVDQEAEQQKLRIGILEIIWRSRYTLIGLAGFGIAMNVSDQTRDVMINLAYDMDFRQQWVPATLLALFSIFSLCTLCHISWLWPRLLCKLKSPRFTATMEKLTKTSDEYAWPSDVERFAEWWPRLLGMLPILSVILLCGQAANDSVKAKADYLPIRLLLFALLSSAVAGLFLFYRIARATKALNQNAYFQSIPADTTVTTELKKKDYDFPFIRHTSWSLPLFALAFAAILRGVTIFAPSFPHPTFAVITFLVAFWLSLISLIAAKAQSNAMPYISGLILLGGLLGSFNITDKHRVWIQSATGGSQDGLETMWWVQLGLAGIVISTLITAIKLRTLWQKCLSIGLCITLGCSLLYWADINIPRSLWFTSPTDLSSQNSASTETGANDQRPLRVALTEWLTHLPLPPNLEAPVNVYFVSTEGGGIRAAYWTALVLAHLDGHIDQFQEKTFSISGVSGGSIGAATYRACKLKAQQTNLLECVQQIGERDLLTPLLGGWLFEDMLGRLVPTWQCTTPGCGILNRDAWFEQTLEASVKELHEPLKASAISNPTTHLPYLLLNSTWVETGERAIASDLLIDSTWFPAAHDQLSMSGHPLSLSTAAHNSARFPYTNSIGSLYGSAKTCHLDPAVKKPSFFILEWLSLKIMKIFGKEPSTILCGHLADGGYFDNSAGHTTGDILRALRIILAAQQAITCSPLTGDPHSHDCQIWQRFSTHLRPHVVQIRSGIDLTYKDNRHCPGETLTASPKCTNPWSFFSDALGPVITQFNAPSANQYFAEATQTQELRGFWPDSSSTDQERYMHTIDLTIDQLYPLGWALSSLAKKGMNRESETCGWYQKLPELKMDSSCRRLTTN